MPAVEKKSEDAQGSEHGAAAEAAEERTAVVSIIHEASPFFRSYTRMVALSESRT